MLPDTPQITARLRIALLLERGVQARLDFPQDRQSGALVESGVPNCLERILSPRRLEDPAARRDIMLGYVCRGYPKVVPDSGLVPFWGEELGSITDRVDDGDLSTEILAL